MYSICGWNFKLAGGRDAYDFVLQCDYFDVGRAQKSGRCWGDSLLIFGDAHALMRRKNVKKVDHLGLCGKRDGLKIRARANSQDRLTVKFKTTNNSQSSGFSCRVYSQRKAKNPTSAVIDTGASEIEEEIVVSPEGEEGTSNYMSKKTPINLKLPFSIVPCHCGLPNRPNIPGRIIGGQYTKPNEYPWQAALVNSYKFTPFCGGSLISPYHILTAAHCTEDIEYASDLKILLGEHDLTTSFDKTNRYAVKRIVEHPGYNKETLANDYSLITLSDKVKFADHIRPICLPDASDLLTESFTGNNGTVSGWGYTTVDPDRDPLTTKLKHTELDILSNKECKKRYSRPAGGWITEIVPAMLCAIRSNTSSCFGDSGGKKREVFFA